MPEENQPGTGFLQNKLYELAQKYKPNSVRERKLLFSSRIYFYFILIKSPLWIHGQE